MKHDDFLQVIRSPFHFATCDAVLRGCKIVDISKPPQWRRLSKKVCSPLGPSARGSARRRWGRELYGCPKYFGLWQGSLPPPLRGTAPPLAQAPPPPYRGSLSRRGRFFDTLKRTLSRPLFYLQIPIPLSPPHNKPSGAYQRHGLGGNYRKPDAVHADDKRQGQDGHDLEQQRAQEGDSRRHCAVTRYQKPQYLPSHSLCIQAL